MMIDELKTRIAELQHEEAAYRAEATARLTAYAATIGELRRWLARIEAESAPPVYTNGEETPA